ncbi:MAG: dihydrolipoamide acetyltransferase family protein [Polyangiales bacterium]|nr:2-oxo acid dehydrogenase subunit E2 [Myxococcales bacterium]
MAITITMPQLGESVAEGEVGKWLVAVGDHVEKDQPLVEILTDKADSEINASSSGVVTQIFADVGATVAVGGKLCELDESASGAKAQKPSKPTAKAPSITPGPIPTPYPPPGPSTASQVGPAARAMTATPAEMRTQESGVDVHASPAVRKFARENNLDLADVARGRVSMDAAKRAAKGSDGAVPPRAAAASTATGLRTPAAATVPDASPDHRLFAGVGPLGAFKLPPYTPRPGDEVVPFTRRRRIIADHMVYSKLNAPHVVTFSEVDLHATSKLRDAHKKEFQAAGLNLTFLAFVSCATAKALTEFRELNARVMDDAYVLLREVNVGIAVDTPEGLVVPVIRNADELSLRGMVRAIDELAVKARENRLAPDDLAHKTFTVSNPGRKGNLVGGAIISQPNVGILRIGEIKKRVVVVEHDGEDLMAIHPVMYMALSYDHRIVDGVHANAFLWRIRELLESADFEV